ncbi:MAG TPA: signal peptide peptidase SppA [Terriglobales bacterium]|nr:MAG: S49 family peptidase [Chloroflexi bacterium 13_1_20CM_2_59_7]HLB86969.1 signal peptide peptidase SppA [Terriglobales bacterium]
MADNGRSRTVLWIVIGGGAFFLFVLAVFTLVYLTLHTGEQATIHSFGDKIGVVDLEGVILDPRMVVPQLKKFGDDNSIKAIILHVNSPGGGVAASEEIYREVKRIRDEKKKRIVASISSVGASGAYYISAATNKIYADKGSIVGSIGVIASWTNYGDLLHWAKLKDITMKAGEFKDTGSPTRDMTPAEKEYVQSLIDNMHTQFIQAVADGRNSDGRKVKVEDIQAIANGKVWTGEQALSLKLIDQVGDFQAAVDDTAKAVGIKGEPVLVHPERERKTVLDLLFGDVSEWLPTREKLLDQHVGFYYLWK